MALLLSAIPAHGESCIPAETIAAPAQPDTVTLPAAEEADREIWHLSETGRYVVRNVTRPTLTVFRPVGKPSPASVIIAPGGAFLGLEIEKEGWDVARWFANHGVTAFVLKYRTKPTPPDQTLFVAELDKMISGQKSTLAPPTDTPAEALADGISALRHVRANAAKLGIDPGRVGTDCVGVVALVGEQSVRCSLW